MKWKIEIPKPKIPKPPTPPPTKIHIPKTKYNRKRLKRETIKIIEEELRES